MTKAQEYFAKVTISPKFIIGDEVKGEHCGIKFTGVVALEHYYSDEIGSVVHVFPDAEYTDRLGTIVSTTPKNLKHRSTKSSKP